MRHAHCKKSGFGLRGFLLAGLLTLFALLTPPAARAQEVVGGDKDNRIVEASIEQENGTAVARIRTEKPVGYRYTVYDSFDPVRVVIDFPGMDISGVDTLIKSDDPVVKEIRISSFELTSGKLGRVELVLTDSAAYEVDISNNEFLVVFAAPSQETAAPDAVTVQTATEVQPEPSVVDAETPSAVESPMMGDESGSLQVTAESVETVEGDSAGLMPSARFVEDVTLGRGQAIVSTDGRIEKFKYFNLSAPPRLVLDIFGVKPRFKTRSFSGTGGFKQARVGSYPDKTRFVFDAEGKTVPKHEVVQENNRILLSWGDRQPAATPAAALPAAGKVVVQNLDFSTENGKSIFTIELSGNTSYSTPTEADHIIRFGVDNASITRSQRRVIDASAFPSAVKLITPYTVQEKGVQQVRFAVELKGSVPYSLERKGDNLQLVVEDGAFAEAPVPALEQQGVLVLNPPPVEEPTASRTKVPGSDGNLGETTRFSAPGEGGGTARRDEPVRAPVSTQGGGDYVGQKISLVFDDADIRKILQLIADVSNQNIIASDDVTGTITLRLIDVPWDQALALVLEIKGLGMLSEGNVMRILPIEKIRAMDEAKLTASRTKEKLEDLYTEVIEVSYTDLDNVVGPAKELLTERGKITADNRNKQVIVTDVASVIVEIRKLVKILDTPERQVLIEARIVEASSTFGRDLGVNWRVNNDNNPGDLPSNAADFSGGGGFLLTPSIASSGLAGGITFGQIGIDSTVLDLRISALETSGNGKVISRPRVTTLNGEEATISQGTQIPYQTVSEKGTTTEFKSAELSLKVTPVINPDGSVILEIDASNSSIGSTVATGAGSAPAIDTKNAKTKLLVMDGETTVIGGIFVESENFGEAGIPFLRKIPILGRLFRSNSQSSTRSELLIFITPRIVN
ncbi:type IV pilus secretin PilQ [Desulfuromonas soudanensis]|uniref:Type IV pilus secretin PilQ n=1 Tax=Desulfuromonas soudanensis TaxID=1603606 RepID=A0A0M4DIB2_9BACT|nr:type IV pilus secretin family protein [Desulfuromonas soudanensis]ALC16912.1 type IV pilus secretin PilQ [Desulfuromonas soudanensis]